MKKFFRKVAKQLNDIAKDYFAPYIVADNMGTFRLCWTMKDAEAWLQYCGSHAVIYETYDYVLQVQRIQK